MSVALCLGIEAVRHPRANANDDRVLEHVSEIVLFLPAWIDPIPLQRHHFQVFAGAEGLVEFGGGLVELFHDRKGVMDALAGRKTCLGIARMRTSWLKASTRIVSSRPCISQDPSMVP